jgi:hypothetical protein
MLRKIAIVVALVLPVLGVAATISSLSQMKSEFVGIHPAQAKPSSGTTMDDLDSNNVQRAVEDDETRDERC